jgi:predicted RNA-binding Zn ribbon-like protein
MSPGCYIALVPQLGKRNKPSIRHEEPRPAPGDLEILRALMNSKENGDGNPEELTSPEELASWLSARELLPEGVSLTDEDLRRAVWLRWALRSLVFTKGEEGEREVGIIRELGESIPFRLVFENGLEPRFEPSGTEVMQAFGRLIQLFADARREDRWRRFKVCGHCREIFYDHTANRSGRWCRTRCGEYERKKVSRRRRRTGRV